MRTLKELKFHKKAIKKELKSYKKLLKDTAIPHFALFAIDALIAKLDTVNELIGVHNENY